MCDGHVHELSLKRFPPSAEEIRERDNESPVFRERAPCQAEPDERACVAATGDQDCDVSKIRFRAATRPPSLGAKTPPFGEVARADVSDPSFGLRPIERALVTHPCSHRVVGVDPHSLHPDADGKCNGDVPGLVEQSTLEALFGFL